MKCSKCNNEATAFLCAACQNKELNIVDECCYTCGETDVKLIQCPACKKSVCRSCGGLDFVLDMNTNTVIEKFFCKKCL